MPSFALFAFSAAGIYPYPPTLSPTLAALKPPMNLSKLLSVSGKPGLYRMINNKPSGLIIEPLGGGVREFAASRQHTFTPVESIAIFTDDGDSVPIRSVFEKMVEQLEDTPLPDAKASSETFREYLLDVLPNHDRERVYVSDIKKLVRWFEQLQSSGALTEEDPNAEAPADESAEPSEASEGTEASSDEVAPAAKKKAASDKKPTDKKPAAKKSGERPGGGGALAGNQNKGGASKAGGKRKMGGGV